MKHQLYFPPHVSQQILWLANFLHHFPFIAAKLNLQPKEVADSLADLEWLLHGLRDLRGGLVQRTKAVTAFNKALMGGKGALAVMPPPMVFPPAPTVPPVRPGALKRVFKLVQRIKHTQGYEKNMGITLGIEANHYPLADAPAPTFKLKVLSGDTHDIVEGRFRRYGRPGVWIECQVGEGDWEPVASGIFCRTTFRDERPLLDPTRPEIRRYRLRYWDANPFGEWSPVASVTVGL